jgi:hypothetical protein
LKQAFGDYRASGCSGFRAAAILITRLRISCVSSSTTSGRHFWRLWSRARTLPKELAARFKAAAPFVQQLDAILR